MYGDAYIRKLRVETEARRAQRAAEVSAAIADPRAKLREEIARWYAALPDAARADAKRQGYVLEDIRKAVQATLQQLGLALDELGWSRKRVWRSAGPYRRRWYPPQLTEPPTYNLPA